MGWQPDCADASRSRDAAQKMLNGKETLAWRNTSTDRVGELQFHLYLNAFKNSESTFMKESGGVLKTQDNRGAASRRGHFVRVL